jgi:hypothetical protein
MTTKRVKGSSTGPGNQSQLRFNEAACSDKVSESGLNFFYGANAGILGALNVAKECGPFKTVYVFNTDAAIRYVRFGNAAVAAPTGAADGFPLLPSTGMMFASGENTHVRSNHALVFGFVAEDNVIADGS